MRDSKYLLGVIVFFLLCLLPAVARTNSVKQTFLDYLSKELTRSFNQIDKSLATAAKELAKNELPGDEARRIVHQLYATNIVAVDCALVSPKGIMTILEPAKYHSHEGAGISQQPQIITLHKTKKPVMSKSIKMVEGFNAIDLEYPIISDQGQLLGSVSLLVKPESMIGKIVEKNKKNSPFDVWVMQLDGRILYDLDSKQIGKVLFSDPLYRPYPDLLKLGKKIVKQKSGTGRYTFVAPGLNKPVKKEAFWTTVSLYGTDWRVVTVRLLP